MRRPRDTRLACRALLTGSITYLVIFARYDAPVRCLVAVGTLGRDLSVILVGKCRIDRLINGTACYVDETTQQHHRLRAQGFDMFHQGHLNILRAARELLRSPRRQRDLGRRPSSAMKGARSGHPLKTL